MGDVAVFWRNDEVVIHRVEENLYEDRELITRGDANEGIDAHPAQYENVVGRAVNQIPGIGYFVMALASLPGKLVLGWVVLMGAAFSIIGTAIASLARSSAAPPPTNLRYFVPKSLVFMLVKPRYFEHGNQPSLFGSRDLVPVMPRLGVWHPSARTGDLVPPVRFRPRIMANLEVGTPISANFGDLVPRPRRNAWSRFAPGGFCGYQTSRFARRRVSNLRSRHEKVPNCAILPRKRPPGYQTSQVAEARQPAWQKARAKPLILQKLNISYLSILQKRNLLSYTALQKPHYCR